MDPQLKIIIQNSCLMTASIIYSVLFWRYLKKNWPDLPSLSESARYLKDKGLVILFYTFITGAICYCLTKIADSWISASASALLGVIGVATGWNPNLKSRKWQNRIHVGLTMTAMAGFLVDLGYKAYLIELMPVKVLFIGLIAFWGILTLILYIAKTPCHTKVIEQTYLIFMVWPVLTYTGIIWPLVEYLNK